MIDGNLQKYMAFVKTVELGSFSRAAEALDYSQSGISRMIHDLEKEWGLTLLERDRTGVRLTSDGLRLLPYAENLCRASFDLEQQVSEVKGLETGIVRIAAFSSVASNWLPTMIQSFQKDYPGIDYEILLGDYGEIEDWVYSGRVDCGLTCMAPEKKLETLFLARDELVVILPEGHRLCRLSSIPVKYLSDEPFLLLEKGGRGEVPDILEACHIHPKVRVTTWDDATMMAMVEKGLGISMEPRLVLKRQAYHIAIRSLEEKAYRNISLLVKDKKTASAAARRFMDCLTDFVSHLPEEESDNAG
ncbi:LysR family transcriptional regulator [uncultured Dialister sp.]|nr:LysR family transcriptional regulator [uncultured Dialister sp.]